MSTKELTLEIFAADAKSIIVKCQDLADAEHHAHVLPIHLLAVLSNNDMSARVLKESGVSLSYLADLISTEIASIEKSERLSTLQPLMTLLGRSERLAGKGSLVSVENLLISLTQETEGTVADIMNILKITTDIIRQSLPSVKEEKKKAATQEYLTDMTALARSGDLDPVIGRHMEVRRLFNILGRRHKNHPIIVGAPGVGKKTIVSALAQKIVAGDVSAKFANLQVVMLDVAKMMSGVKTKGEGESRLKKSIASIDPSRTILFIDGVESLFGQGASGTGDLLSSLLARDYLRIITSTTPEAFKKLSDKESGITNQLTPLHVKSPTEEEAMEVLRGIATRYETFHKVKVGEPAIVAAVKLAKRYIQDRALPESAIDLLDEAASRKKFEVDGLSTASDQSLARYSSLKAQLTGLVGDDDKDSNKARSRIEEEISTLSSIVEGIKASISDRKRFRKEEVILTEEDIAGVLQDWTGILSEKMLEADVDKMGKIEDTLSGRVVGQTEAVRAVSKAIRRSRLGLRDVGKPIGSFLFLGSSGVGKTELAKALANFLFDDDKAMIRFDMSEFKESHQIARLTGSPPGYTGSDDGGQLTEAVLKTPYSVILFDEIEKAHADVFNLLLQVLDDGRLSDSKGKLVDFTNTVVIMTTNIGTKNLLEADRSSFETKEGLLALQEMLKGELKNFLRPELLNRIDETVIFQPLGKPELKKIVDIQTKIMGKLLSNKEVSVKLTDEAKDHLVEVGYEPSYGARPLKRAMMKLIQDPIGERMVAGQCKPGTTVEVSFDSSEIVLTEVK